METKIFAGNGERVTVKIGFVIGFWRRDGVFVCDTVAECYKGLVLTAGGYRVSRVVYWFG